MRLTRLDHFGVDVADLGRGKSHHAFEVGWNDLKAAETLFAERGVPYHAPIDRGDHDGLYFLDPDGNLLELVGYRPKGERT